MVMMLKTMRMMLKMAMMTIRVDDEAYLDNFKVTRIVTDGITARNDFPGNYSGIDQG